MSPSPHGLVGIRLAEKQKGLMEKFGFTSQDVVELLMLRGDLERAPNLTVSRLRHIFSLIEGEARVERGA